MEKSIFSGLLLIGFVLHGQVNMDSLQQVLDNTAPTAENMADYLEGMMRYGPNDIEVTLLIGDWVKNNAKKENLPESLANAYLNLSHAYIIADNYGEATKYLIEADRVAEENKLFITQAIVYNTRAVIFYSNKQNNEAIQGYKKSLELSEKIGYQRGVAVSKYNLAGLYLEISGRNDDTIQLCLKLDKEAMEIAKQIKDTINIIKYGTGTIRALVRAKQYDTALDLLNETESFIKAYGKKTEYVFFYMGKAQVYRAKMDYSKALESWYSMLETAKVLKMPKWVFNAYTGLALVYEDMGNYKEANKYNILYSKVHDSLVSVENYKYTADLQNRYEREKKQKEILILKASNEKKAIQNQILIGSSLGILAFGFLGFRNFRNKRKLQNQKIAELEKDKQILAIDAMLKGQEEERSRIAKDLHDGLGGLLSGTKLSFSTMKENLILTPENAAEFDKSLRMLDHTIGDLRKVAHNLMPEALVKYGLNEALRDFCSSIQASSKLEVTCQILGVERKLTNTAEVFVYRILQELVTNAIKHAEATEIIVQLSYMDTKIALTVEDNGKGYDAESIKNKKGIGLENIAYRVQYLNGTMDTVTAPDNGTSVNIELHV